MTFSEFMTRTTDTLKEKSPEILVGVGFVSLAAGIVFACKATVKIHEKKKELKAEVEKTVEEAKQTMNDIDEGLEEGAELKDGSTYDENMAMRDKGIVYGQTAGSMIKTGFKVAKEYAPAAGFIVVGFACIFMSHKILRDRNAALLTAYTALDSAFKAYRARVIKDGGKELDAKYLYGTKTEVKEVKKINPDTGLEETSIETEEVIDYPLGSPYARLYNGDHVFEGLNPDTMDSAYLRAHLEQLQSYANEKLNKNGYLFLNDVYDMLGLAKSPEGQIVGWVKDDPNGDGYVDFNIKLSYTDPRFKHFIEPGTFRRQIVLDFNVDGPIINKAGWKIRGKNDLSDEDLKKIDTFNKLAKRFKDEPEYIEAENERIAVMNK